jgi:homogentisate 1,2-dioxygenase
MSAPGPDAETTERATAAGLLPRGIDTTLAFRFATRQVRRPTRHALERPELQRDHDAYWHALRRTLVR